MKTHSLTRFRRGAFVAGITALATVAGVMAGTSTATASPVVQAAVDSAGAGCPAGTHTLVPDEASLSAHGTRALMTPAIQAADPSAVNDPTLKKIAAMKAHWVTKVQCQVTQQSMGPAVLHSQAAKAATEGTMTSTNWSGYVMHQAGGQNGFAHAGMQWTLGAEATAGPTNLNVSESDWPGIGTGDSSSDMLIQAGSDIERSRTTNEVFPWYELFPQENEVEITNLPTVSQAAVHYMVDVQYDPTANTAYFTVCESNQCASLSQQLNGSAIGRQAEWIRERPEFGGILHPLASVSTETFTNLSYTPGPGFDPSAQVDRWVMASCQGTTMVNPGGISSTDTVALPVYNDGVQEPVNC